MNKGAKEPVSVSSTILSSRPMLDTMHHSHQQEGHSPVWVSMLMCQRDPQK